MDLRCEVAFQGMFANRISLNIQCFMNPNTYILDGKGWNPESHVVMYLLQSIVAIVLCLQNQNQQVYP